MSTLAQIVGYAVLLAMAIVTLLLAVNLAAGLLASRLLRPRPRRLYAVPPSRPRRAGR